MVCFLVNLVFFCVNKYKGGFTSLDSRSTGFMDRPAAQEGVVDGLAL